VIKQSKSKLPFLSLLFLVTSFNVLPGALAREYSSSDMPHKTIKAIISTDNDISVNETPGGQLVEIPSPVRKIMDTVVRTNYLTICKEEANCGNLPIDYFYGTTFRLNAPQNRFLFVFTLNYPLGGSLYCFILFDPISNQVTQEPFAVNNKWIELRMFPIKRPIVSFDDLGQDGHHQLRVTEIEHYGTDESYYSYEYLQIKPDLSFKSVFKYIAEMNDPISPDRDREIVATFKKLKRNEIEIDKFLRIRNQQDQKIGEAVFGRDDLDQLFQLRSKNILNHSYDTLFEKE